MGEEEVVVLHHLLVVVVVVVGLHPQEVVEGVGLHPLLGAEVVEGVGQGLLVMEVEEKGIVAAKEEEEEEVVAELEHHVLKEVEVEAMGLLA